MKKILIIALALVMVFAATANTYAMSIDELVEGVNNYKTVKAYAEYGSVWKASRSEQGMDIDIDANGNHYDLDFVLNGSILTLETSGDNGFTAAMGCNFVIDIVETALGYEEGEYTKMYNAGDVGNFTVENDGIELIEKEDGGLIFKIDLEKKATPVDLSNIYLTKEDFENYHTFDDNENSSIQTNKGLVHFYREVFHGENVIFIGEKGGPTQCSYNTLLSVIAILKGDDAATAYAAKCPDVNSLTSGDDFDVAVGEGTEDYEFNLMLDDGYTYIKFTYDDGTWVDNDGDILDDEDGENDIDTENKSSNAIYYIICAVVVIAIVSFVILKKKKNQ